MASSDKSKETPAKAEETEARTNEDDPSTSDSIPDAVVVEETSRADSPDDDRIATKTKADETGDEATGGDPKDASGVDDVASDASVQSDTGSETMPDGSADSVYSPYQDDALTGDDGRDRSEEASAGTDDDSLASAARDDSLAGDTDSETSDEPAGPKDRPTPPATVMRETVVERKGGFVPMVLGGVVAAALGFGAAYYAQGAFPFQATGEDPFETETRASLGDVSARVEDLSARMGDAESAIGAVDLGSVDASVTDLATRIEGLSDNLGSVRDEVEALGTRIEELEKRPMEEAVSPEAIAAYERELERLRTDVEQQRQEISNMAAEAVAAEQNAEGQARLAQARGALAQISAALQEGSGFSEAAERLASAGVVVPDALSGVASEGAPTLNQLVEQFPDAARDALSAARGADTQENAGGIRLGDFLRDQLGARSVTPRDGDDPDAVLSRAELALRGGDIAAALSEVRSLPDPARAPLADWTAQAEARLAVSEAVESLAQQLNEN